MKVESGEVEDAIKLLQTTEVEDIVQKQLEQSDRVFLATEGYRVSIVSLDDDLGVANPKSVLIIPGLAEHDKLDADWSRSVMPFASEFNLHMFSELAKRNELEPLVTLGDSRIHLGLTDEAWNALPKLEQLKLQQFVIRYFSMEQILKKHDEKIFGSDSDDATAIEDNH